MCFHIVTLTHCTPWTTEMNLHRHNNRGAWNYSSVKTLSTALGSVVLIDVRRAPDWFEICGVCVLPKRSNHIYILHLSDTVTQNSLQRMQQFHIELYLIRTLIRTWGTTVQLWTTVPMCTSMTKNRCALFDVIIRSGRNICTDEDSVAESLTSPGKATTKYASVPELPAVQAMSNLPVLQ